MSVSLSEVNNGLVLMLECILQIYFEHEWWCQYSNALFYFNAAICDPTTSQKVLDHQKHTPVSVCMAPTLTLDSVVKVPFSLNGLL